jgi:dihydroxyacetone kinase-like predicted kinase
MLRYDLEFVLGAHNLSSDIIRGAINELGEGVEIVEVAAEKLTRYSDFQVRISTLDPTVVFDACSQMGRIKSVKIEEKKI